jgi:ABC-type molybdate transport system ATPase subunit
LPGRIVNIRREGAKVIAKVDVGKELEVHVTPAAFESLGLAANKQVWLVIKTHSLHRVATT